MNRPTHLLGGTPQPSAYDPSSSDDNKASDAAPLVSSASVRQRLEDDAAMALVGLCVGPLLIARPPLTMTASPKTTEEIEDEKKKKTVAKQNGSTNTNKSFDPDKKKKNATKKDNDAFFPVVLMSIVSDPLNSDVISWTPSGLSFVVLKPYDLADYVLPRHFNKGKVGKYCSFARKLSRYGFRKSTAVPAASPSTKLGEDVFSHPLFLRDAPELCRNIRVGTSTSGPSVSRRRCSASSSSSVAKKKNSIKSSEAQPLHTSVSSSSSSSSTIAFGSVSSVPRPPAMVSPLLKVGGLAASDGGAPTTEAAAANHRAMAALLPSPPLVAAGRHHRDLPPARNAPAASLLINNKLLEHSAAAAAASSPSLLIDNKHLLERSAVQSLPRPLLSSLPASSSPSIVRDGARRAARLHFLARRQSRRRANVEALGRMNLMQRLELARDYDPSGEEVRMILRRALEVMGNGPQTTAAAVLERRDFVNRVA